MYAFYSRGLTIWILLCNFTLCMCSPVDFEDVSVTGSTLNKLTVSSSRVNANKTDFVGGEKVSDSKVTSQRNQTQTGNTSVQVASNMNDSSLYVYTYDKDLNGSRDQNVTETGSENQSGNHLNLAIIPALAILVLLIVGCLKCCSCFRKYTRAGDKEDCNLGNEYAVIVQDGDEDYGYVDLKSDTTSTACYDTVSSYCSFMKRNNNDNTVTSSRSFKVDAQRPGCGSPRREFLQRLLIAKDSEKSSSDRKVSESENECHSETFDSYSPRSDSAMSDYLRTVSISSEETEPLSTSLSESNDFSEGRRSQRFKVSFVTEHTSVPKRSFSVNDKRRPILTSSSIKRSSLKKSLMATSGLPTEQSSQAQSNDQVFKRSLKPSLTNNEAVTMKDVGTQTDRSFRYKLWKEKRRHLSDSGIDASNVPPTIDELTTHCSCKTICDNSCKPRATKSAETTALTVHKQPLKTKKDKRNFIPDSSDGITADVAKLETFEYSTNEAETNDEVFLSNDESDQMCNPHVKPHCDKNEHDSVLVNGDVSIDTDVNIARKVGQKQNASKHVVSRGFKVDAENFQLEESECKRDNVSCHSCPGGFSRPVLVHDNQLLNRYSLPVGKDSKLLENGVVSGCPYKIDLCCDAKLQRTQNSVPCVRCVGTVTTPSNFIDVSKVICKRNPTLERETSLISEELTSSTTSLESSGYAEISSESSS